MVSTSNFLAGTVWRRPSFSHLICSLTSLSKTTIILKAYLNTFSVWLKQFNLHYRTQKDVVWNNLPQESRHLNRLAIMLMPRWSTVFEVVTRKFKHKRILLLNWHQCRNYWLFSNKISNYSYIILYGMLYISFLVGKNGNPFHFHPKRLLVSSCLIVGLSISVVTA